MWEAILDFGSQCTGLSSLTLVGAWLSRGIPPMFHRVPEVTKLVILRGEVLRLPADVPPNNTVKSMTFGGNMDGGLFLSNILPLFGNLKALYLLTTQAQRFRYRPSGLSDNSFRTLEKFVVSKLHPSDLEDVFEWISSCLIMLQLDRVTPSLTHLKIDVQQIEEDDIWGLKCTLSHCPLRCLVLGYFKMVPADIYDTLSFAFPNLIALTLIRQIDCHEQSVEWTPREMVIWEHATEVARFPNLVHFGWNYRPLLPKASSSSIILLENDFFEPLDFEDDDIPNDSDTTHEMSLIVQLFASRCPNLQTMTFDPEEIAPTNGPSMNYKIRRSAEGFVSVDTITDSHCFSHYNPISPNNPEWS
ncbi:hypothetical protein C8Q75DRAFT_610567 [Abortiporus biennis]|nr:hypothetical protein C8Q75DRAFT_610567 [Abortiporus biennis]